jgi:hypothetical protein
MSELSKALFAAQDKFPRIAKSKQGQAGHRAFNYAPLDDILDAVRPALRENGLMMTNGTDGHSLVTRLDHIPSGEHIEYRMPVNAEHANMQSYGIELTYRRRYSVQLVLGIVTEEDIDIKTKEKRKGVDFTGGDDGKNKDLTPFISEVRREELMDCALTMIALQDEGREMEAAKMYYKLPSNEEKLFVWGQFKGGKPGQSTPGSRLRAFIKANQPTTEEKA